MTNKRLDIQQISKKSFPEELLEIPQPPKKLFILGKLPAPETKFLTVVGSRKFSSYGKEACENIIAGLQGYNISIVSGMALGTDTIAHNAALEAGLHTVAGPGSGLDPKVIYPRTNFHLAERIVESGGALLSEFEPDFRATRWSFPQRNRIMAGLADAVLITESTERSGTLITARMAVDYNKTVLAVPGSIFSENSKGTNRLLARGAMPVMESADVLEAFNIEIEEKSEENTRVIECTAQEAKILELLHEPTPRDNLIREARLSAEEANSLLSLLEIKGLIKEVGGKIYRNV
jgi:DNA processing protein